MPFATPSVFYTKICNNCAFIQDLLVELEVFDKMFLQRKDVIRLVGKVSLDQVREKHTENRYFSD